MSWSHLRGNGQVGVEGKSLCWIVHHFRDIVLLNTIPKAGIKDSVRTQQSCQSWKNVYDIVHVKQQKLCLLKVQDNYYWAVSKSRIENVPLPLSDIVLSIKTCKFHWSIQIK